MRSALLPYPARGWSRGLRVDGAARSVPPEPAAHAGTAAFAIPDLIEEAAVSTLHDGGQVQEVPDPPGGIAAYLRFPLSRSDSI